VFDLTLSTFIFLNFENKIKYGKHATYLWRRQSGARKSNDIGRPLEEVPLDDIRSLVEALHEQELATCPALCIWRFPQGFHED
jgi:hypothetical protein